MMYSLIGVKSPPEFLLHNHAMLHVPLIGERISYSSVPMIVEVSGVLSGTLHSRRPSAYSEFRIAVPYPPLIVGSTPSSNVWKLGTGVYDAFCSPAFDEDSRDDMLTADGFR